MNDFPLIHIRNDTHLEEALGVLNQLLCTDPDEGAREYLNVLTDLIAAYEDEHVPISDVSEYRRPARAHAIQPAQSDASGQGGRNCTVHDFGRPDGRSFAH